MIILNVGGTLQDTDNKLWLPFRKVVSEICPKCKQSCNLMFESEDNRSLCVLCFYERTIALPIVKFADYIMRDRSNFFWHKSISKSPCDLCDTFLRMTYFREVYSDSPILCLPCIEVLNETKAVTL